MTVHREQSMKREDQQDTKIRCLLLTSESTCFGHHYARLQENKGPVTEFDVLFCNKRENVYISRDVFFCVVNRVGNSCEFANVVCKWVCRGVGLVSASCVFQSGVSGAGVLVCVLCLFVGRNVWCGCYP
jgi:hypothetical protein